MIHRHSGVLGLAVWMVVTSAGGASPDEWGERKQRRCSGSLCWILLFRFPAEVSFLAFCDRMCVSHARCSFPTSLLSERHGRRWCAS